MCTTCSCKSAAAEPKAGNEAQAAATKSTTEGKAGSNGYGQKEQDVKKAGLENHGLATHVETAVSGEEKKDADGGAKKNA